MTTKPQLPLPPEFPASNASYNKIVDKMHKAALNAATSAAAIAAVQMCQSMVKGINTYAKASRRYGDKLIEALGTTDQGAADLAAGNDYPDEATVDQAEAAVAAAEDGHVVDLPVGKSFSNKSNAKRALKAAQLDHLLVEWAPGEADKPFRPILLVDSGKAAAYVAERGFTAKVQS